MNGLASEKDMWKIIVNCLHALLASRSMRQKYFLYGAAPLSHMAPVLRGPIQGDTDCVPWDEKNQGPMEKARGMEGFYQVGSPSVWATPHSEIPNMRMETKTKNGTHERVIGQGPECTQQQCSLQWKGGI